MIALSNLTFESMTVIDAMLDDPQTKTTMIITSDDLIPTSMSDPLNNVDHWHPSPELDCLIA